MVGNHLSFLMTLALEEAQKAIMHDEVPVGAVLVDQDSKIIAKAHNLVETSYDASAHAEMIVMREAARKRVSSRLLNCTLIVTLEPCAMCAAAISHFRIKRLIYGAYDPKGGGVDHGGRFFQRSYCFHKPDEIIGGVREREAGQLLKSFFHNKR